MSRTPIDWEEHCFRFTKPQRMSGLWRNGFEFQVFCAAPAKQCPEPRTRPHDIPVYGNVEFRTYPKGAADVPPDGVYAIDFIGRRSIYPLFGGANEIGKRVIVERLLAIKLVDPPPPGLMTTDLIAAYRKDCAGASVCMPNSEVGEAKVKAGPGSRPG